MTSGKNAPTVVVEGLSKTYRVFETPWERFREAVTGAKRHREFSALSDVSFEIHSGEGLAVIGENGAGKSTLLKILAGITEPTSGTARVEGSVASILELGSGFHPELTGRQNIVLNAAMLGLSEARIEEKVPDILAFSELGDFIDQPVKVYSTGMAMRLGFAIATQVEPEVLIIDEALSVGDGYFQKKCIDQVERFTRSGRTLLFCSHAMYYATSFCDRAVWLRGGRVEAYGPVLDVVHEYESYLVTRSGERQEQEEQEEPTVERGRPVRLLDVTLSRTDGETPSYRHGDPWSLEVEWQTDDAERPVHVAVGIDRTDRVQVCAFGTQRGDREPLRGRMHYRLALEVPELPILKGEFSVTVFLLDEHGLHVYDQMVLERAFRIENRSYQVGLFLADHEWRQVEPRGAGKPDLD